MISQLMNKNPVKLRFRRFEFKYLIEQSMTDKIIRDIANYMDWDSYVSDNSEKFYRVNSLYFDTAGFGCYQEKIAGIKDRRKLRLRTYADEINPETPVFLEIKRKNDMIILKDRLMSNYQESNAFISRGRLNSLAGKDSLQDQELLNEFLWLKNYNCLLPKIMVVYKRKPLVGQIDHKFRITFDSDIRTYPANRLFFSKKSVEVSPGIVVMELKYNNVIPFWFHQIIQKYQLKREPFSKYCQSLETCQKYYHHV